VPRIRIGLAQINPVVGDLHGNTEAICEVIARATDDGCDVVVLPELAVTGYPPEDLVLKPGFVAANLDALDRIAASTGDCAAVVGFVDADRDLHNSAAVCVRGEVIGRYRKRILPNYGVFDEARYFTPGGEQDPVALFVIAGVNVGVSICEDVWSPNGPLADQAAGGAEVVLNLNASPYHRGKVLERERMLQTRAADASCALVYVNQVGGQDELVFDGASMVIDSHGRLVARAASMREQLLVVDLDVDPVYRKRLVDPRGRPVRARLPVTTVSARTRTSTPVARADDPLVPSHALTPLHDGISELYEALVLGTRDYVRKNGFTDVVIGLSGGIDSALVSCVAVDALGPEHVHTVAMPSRYSSSHSVADAALLAERLGVDHRLIGIEPAFQAWLDMLAHDFAGLDADLTEENLQSRCRGTTLMALSNKFGWMVLTTGNKSEMAVGYFTLYGDSVGGFAVIRDVFKTDVYALCRHVNERAGREIVPESILVKAPSAELRPDQRDDQSLPPYDQLDAVLARYVDDDRTVDEIVAQGFDADVVRRVARLVDTAEYKRRQCPPGVRVSTKAFGKDRRLPMTNGFRGENGTGAGGR
jgi:NAD+ synthase (glutamine-hydrolysing)